MRARSVSAPLALPRPQPSWASTFTHKLEICKALPGGGGGGGMIVGGGGGGGLGFGVRSIPGSC